MSQITYLPRNGKANSKIRRYLQRGELMARRAEEAKACRSTEEIFDSIFGDPEAEQTTLSLRPTKHYASSDNRCLNDVAIYSTTKHREKPRTDFGVTARG